MKKFLWISIVGSAIGGIILLAGVPAANHARQPAGLPVDGQTACTCSHLKELQIELRNALRLQQAFHNKIPELRTMNGDSAQIAVKGFAQGAARRGLETIPNYNGPSEVDYSPWGENQRTFNFPNEKLCGMSDSATVVFDKAVAAAACAGIGKALRAHEDVHGNMCRSVGYKAYLGMHGADRAQEEVEAYGAQIKVLRDIINHLTCGYRASGKFGDTVCSGIVCSLEQRFIIKNNNPFIQEFEFAPSSATAGQWAYSYKNGVSGGGGGTYTIEGADTGAGRITLTGTGIATAPIAGSGSGTVHIDLAPLESGECAGK